MAPICYNYLHVIRMQEYFASGQVWYVFLLSLKLLARLATVCSAVAMARVECKRSKELMPLMQYVL